MKRFLFVSSGSPFCVEQWEHPAALTGPTIDWARLRRILVIRPDNLGDVVMAGPALRALRQAAPYARLDLLASPAGATVAPLMSELDSVLVASVSWQQLDPTAVLPHEDQRLVEEISHGGYDAAIILTSFSQSPWPAAYLCRLAGVPVRIGMSKEFGGAGLTHWVPALPDDLHQVDRMLRLLEMVGVPPVEPRLRLTLPEHARAAARETLRACGLPADEARYALLLPGASCPSRRYPPDRFAAVARLLTDAGLRVIVAGTAKESVLVDQVTTDVPGAVAVVGQLTVPALAAVVADASVVVCNNSGGAHLASAFDVPSVVLFAGTERVRQYTPRFAPVSVLTVHTDCSPCRRLRCPYHLECLDIPAEQVAGWALRLAGPAVPVVPVRQAA